MNYMPGQRLDEAWGTLTTTQKTSIAYELLSYVNQLRALKGDYIGAIKLGPLNSDYVWAFKNGEVMIGPDPSMKGGPSQAEKEFNEFLLRDIFTLVPETSQDYAKSTLTDDHEIVFTHFNVTPRNILVEGGHVTAVLGWESASWYPECWESVIAREAQTQMHD